MKIEHLDLKLNLEGLTERCLWYTPHSLCSLCQV